MPFFIRNSLLLEDLAQKYLVKRNQLSILFKNLSGKNTDAIFPLLEKLYFGKLQI